MLRAFPQLPLECAQSRRQAGPSRGGDLKSLGVNASVEVVGQTSVPVAQVTQEPCRPAFGLLAHSLHHQGDVKEQNRKRRRREGWEPVRHVEEPNPLRPPLEKAVAVCWKCDSGREMA